jgi:mRNA-degrading endonuclease toxin of MazEF toxin-antitoxin module
MFAHRRFVVVSANELTEFGTVIVAEFAEDEPAGPRGVLSVAAQNGDYDLHGVVLAWRVNWMQAKMLGPRIGRLSDSTMYQVDMALRAALDLH